MMIQGSFDFWQADQEAVTTATTQPTKRKQPRKLQAEPKTELIKDNMVHRAFFSLPEIRASNQTLPSVPELPPKCSVTGDAEIDAVLWLREVISTGQPALIKKAMEAAKRIKTPIKELGKRYTQHVVATNPGNMFAGLSSFGFDDLDGLASRSIEKLTRHNEATARFGNAVFVETPAEIFCIETLVGTETDRFGFLDKNIVDQRFNAITDLMPHTLADCLHEMSYWKELYRLRNASKKRGEYYDSLHESNARDDYVFRCLARIRPQSKAEAVAVLQYMIDKENDLMDRKETNDILLNLIG